jgi:hypothetical protein
MSKVRSVNFLLFFGFTKNHIKFRKISKKYRPKKYNSENLILIENRPYLIDLAGLQAFIPVVINYHKANVIVYDFTTNKETFFLKRFIKFRFSLLSSIARSKYLSFTAKTTELEEHKNLIDELTSGKYTKEQFQNFVYREILIGDLIYDIYLRKTTNLTLNFDSALRFHISTMLQYCDQLDDFFKKNQIKVVAVSHPVYHFGIPARLAIKYGVDAFLVDATYLTKFTSSNPYPYVNNFSGLKAQFGALNGEQKKLALEAGRKRLSQRLSGNYDDLKYVNPDIKNKINLDFQIPKDDKINVLVALHDFNDSPHRYGNNLYVDFYEWLTDLCEITKKSKIRLLIKPHPWALRNIEKELRILSEHYNHILVIPGITSIKTLADLGLKFALTMHGHIAHEAPALGIRVVNACIKNPHFEYDFSLTPNSLEVYRKTIIDIEKLDYDISLDSLHEYYFVKYIHNLISWTIPNYSSFLKSMGKIRNFDNLATLSWLLNQSNQIAMECKFNTVKNFILSNDLYIQKKHFQNSSSSHGVNCNCRILQV